MRSVLRVGLAFFSGAFIITGCGHKVPNAISSSDKQAFDSAPPEIKQVWLNGLEAANTNDYVTAQNLFYSLMDQDLSPAQKQAVANGTTIVMNRLYSGVEKGDPAALKAMEELRRNPPNRPPR
jgi:hypothetical protein